MGLKTLIAEVRETEVGDSKEGRMRKTRMRLLLTVIIASVAWPSEGARIPMVTGIIYDGYMQGSVSCYGLNELRFAGRMPAGNTAYPVGGGPSGCIMGFEEGKLALDAQTLSGRAFHWDCQGRTTWRRDAALEDLVDNGGVVTYYGSCTTQGFAPRFVFRMVLALDGDLYEDGKYNHPVKGVYWGKAA
jgi:hypothetical protein